MRSLAYILNVAFLAAPVVSSLAAEENADFATTVQPLLIEYCYDCHGDGSDKGNVAFDTVEGAMTAPEHRDLWLAVLKNLRAGVMPPNKKPRPDAAEMARIEHWIKREAFQIDSENPDPGRVTLRRLNRVEYQNTIRDLMGVEFRAYEEFPPDDTGYGFDNIGDVLTTSPLLLEKYMDAAETIVTKAVPTVARMLPEQRAGGGEFRSEDGGLNAANISFYQAAQLSRKFELKTAGEYRLLFSGEIDGAFDFDPGRAKLTWKLNDEVLTTEEHKWQDGKKLHHEFRRHLPPGEHRVELVLEPLVPESEKKTHVNLQLREVILQGPLAEEHWVKPPNYERFFPRDFAPTEAEARRQYAGEVLHRFAMRAFRRPVDDRTVERLADIAEAEYSLSERTFEQGVARAMVAVLASPRFIFRTEDVEAKDKGALHPMIDEWALASRLSYFLWSTMPDDELLALAGRNELRQNLPGQVKRMLTDNRSREFVENFVGQWLQTRDVEGISIDERSVLARDAGADREQERRRARFRELREIPDEQLTEEQKKELEEIRATFRRRRGPTVELTGELRRAMRRESELVFDHIVREDRSVVELLDSDYTFANEVLANHYGIEGVSGGSMRKVELPEGSPRGGVLTQGSVLVVTSNPTRTSPVKRGVFLLDQILGLPAPPPPADVPLLEDSEKEFGDREPTLRETLELHRSKPLCKSCHDRMDPLGLALENFNALGMWRETERQQPIAPAGELITGERFSDIRELKQILANDRRLDFYHCLTEKLLTYALGRGVAYYDTQAMDEIVARLKREDGRFSALLLGVIESVPFQRRRGDEAFGHVRTSEPATQLAQTQEQP